MHPEFLSAGYQSLSSLDRWVKVAQIVQGLLTPIIAFIIGYVSWGIQRQQSRIHQQQADTNRRQYRLALFERRIKIFNATQEFISLVLQGLRVETLDPLFKFIEDTREDHLLFGPEIGEYINDVYVKGVALHRIFQASKPTYVLRSEDVAEHTELSQWFTGQHEVAKGKFLKYIDFREP